MKSWSDSHSHLSDPRWGAHLSARQHEVVERAQSQGIRFFLQGGVGPADWERQKKLKSLYPDQIGLCFGVHPYFVAENSREVCESALDQLARELPRVMALGEMGLDFRPHILADREVDQVDIFVAQMELAEFSQKPMVLHLVRSFEKVKEIFSHYGGVSKRGMVHSFNGSSQEAEFFLQHGLHLSIGGRLCWPENQRLRQSVGFIPLDKILLESDSPDQPSPRFQGGFNEPLCILEVAEIIAEIKKISKEEVLDIATQNLEKLLHGKH